jgi:cytochrome c biogenesis protein CcmG, thiol:disulfide interchange protein DsbE
VQQLQPEMQVAGEAGAKSRRLHFPLFFWVLVVLSVTCIGAGVWWLLAGSAASLSGEPGAPVPAAMAGTPAVDFTLADLKGYQVKLSDLRGQVVLLNFWATWCPPCKAEMPDLQALYQEQTGRHNFTVLGVDVEESQAATQAFAKQYGLTFPLLPDATGKVSNDRYSIRSIPTSFIIDRNGMVRYRWTGQQSRATMQAMLEKVW